MSINKSLNIGIKIVSLTTQIITLLYLLSKLQLANLLFA
ncbi:hypothetical protein FHW22_000673|nr:hypothetical protein [Enterobacter ludwigii]